jgi:uncharacterized protein with FMN-binding domain
MRRAILAVLGTATGTALLVGLKANAHAPAGALAAHAPGGAPAAADPGGGPALSAPPGPSAGASAAAAASGAAGTPGAAGTTTAPPRGSGLHDGSFTGPVVSTKYGPVQVRVTVSGGRMTDVVAVQLPTAELRSVRINERAVPILRQEALTAQSASIDTVSGATYTSNGYRGSLQSALDAARRG